MFYNFERFTTFAVALALTWAPLASMPGFAAEIISPSPAHHQPIQYLFNADPLGRKLVRQCILQPCYQSGRPLEGHYRYGSELPNGSVAWFEALVKPGADGDAIPELDPSGRRLFKQEVLPSQPGARDGQTFFAVEDNGQIYFHRRDNGRYFPQKIKGNPSEPLPGMRALRTRPQAPIYGGSSEQNAPSKDYFFVDGAATPPEVVDTRRRDSVGRQVFRRYQHRANNRGFVQEGTYGGKEFTPFEYPGSNYPATQPTGTVKPLPRNQSPVLTSVPTFSSAIEGVLREKEAWRPSLLGQTLEGLAKLPGATKRGWKAMWNPKNSAPFKINPDDPNYRETAQFKNLSKTAQQYTGFASFYVAMGVLAGLRNLQDAPNNPVAWDNYAKSLTDPQGLMMTAGFMGVMYPFMSKVRGFDKPTGIIRSIPAFTAGMMIALGGQFLLMELMDKDNQKCLDNWTLRLGGRRDMAACDRAFEKFTAENLSLQWGPIVANTLTTTGLFLGVNLASSLIGLPKMLASLPYMSTLRGNIAGMIVSSFIFVYLQQQSDVWLDISTKTLAMQLTDWSIANNPYGGGITTVETNLYSNWTKYKARNFVDLPKPDEVDIDPVCQEAAKNIDEANSLERGLGAGVLPIQCYTNRSLDVHGLIDRFAKLHATWRTRIAFAHTGAAFRQWQAKIAEYHSMQNIAFEYYTKLIDHLITEQETPNLASDDVRGFNPTAVRALQKSLAAEVEAEKITLPETANSWRYVRTDTMLDYLVTSMACGPEGSGFFVQEPDGNWGKFLHYVEDYAPSVIGDRFKDHTRLISNAPGNAARFFPPRIVKHIPGQGGSVCDTPPVGNALNLFGRAMDFAPAYFSINQKSWFGFGEGPRYRDLFDYIKRNVRPGIASRDRNQLPEWWAKNLGPAIYATEKDFRDEYVKMLQTTYRTDLTRTTYYHCDVAPAADRSLSFYLNNLGLKAGAECPSESTHTLAKGVWTGIHDDLRLYLSMLVDQEAAHAPETADKLRLASLQAAAERVLAAFDLRYRELAANGQSLALTHDEQKAAIKASADIVFKTVIDLMTLLAPTHEELYSDLDCEKGTVTQSLFCQINALNKEGLMYNQVLAYVYAEQDRMTTPKAPGPDSGSTIEPASTPDVGADALQR